MLCYNFLDDMKGGRKMWEYLLVLCMVTNFEGAPINKCFGNKSSVQYPSKDSCMAAAKAEDYRVYLTLRDKDQGLPIIKTACGRKDKET